MTTSTTNRVLRFCAIVSTLSLIGSLIATVIWQYDQFWDAGTKTSAIVLGLILIYFAGQRA